MALPNFAVGDKVLVTTDQWFLAPDGSTYRSAYGTVKGIHTDVDTLGIKTNVRSTNWYLEIGDMIIAGCQIHYAIKTEDVNLGDSEGWSVVEGVVNKYTAPSSIYNAGEG